MPITQDHDAPARQHPNAAPIAFVDSYLADLVLAALYVSSDDVEIIKAKLRLAITLLGCIRCTGESAPD